jgi:hypothetical protein
LVVVDGRVEDNGSFRERPAVGSSIRVDLQRAKKSGGEPPHSKRAGARKDTSEKQIPHFADSVQNDN